MGKNSSGQFTKGNTYGKGGRSKYKKRYAIELIAYFNVPPKQTIYEKNYYSNGNLKSEKPIVLGSDCPTFEGFAKKIGVTARTLVNWCERYPSFAEAYEMALDMQRSLIIINGLGGMYNGNFAKFVACNYHGMTDKNSKSDDGGSSGGGDGLEVVITLLKERDSEKA